MSLDMLRAMFARPKAEVAIAQGVGAGEPVGKSDRFAACLPHILKHEGGYVDHPRDPGGATNMGITIGTLSEWRSRTVTKKELRNITPETVAAIYRARYWDAVRADELGPGLDLAVFDYAVNSGPGRAAKALQAALGVPADGGVGPVTLAALAGRDRAALIEDICARRRAFLQSLSTYDTFGRGWEKRVAAVEAAALAA